VSRAAIGARGHVGGGGTGLGLGDAGRRLVAAQHRFGREAFLCIAVGLHDGRDRTHVRLDGDASGLAAGARHLLNDDRGVEKAAAGAAIGVRDGVAHQSGVTQRGDIVPQIGFRPVHLGRTRRDYHLGKTSCLAPQALPFCC
jgi:hypothetical protein